jgi:hypothetical protein
VCLGFGSVRHGGGEVPTFSLFDEVRGLVWIKVKRCQLVVRGEMEGSRRSLNNYLKTLMTLRLFAECFNAFCIKHGKYGKDIESFAK